MILKTFPKFLALSCFAVALYSCSNDDETTINAEVPEFNAKLEVVYGESLKIPFSEATAQNPEAKISLDFSKIEAVQINDNTSLNTALEKAFTIHNGSDAHIELNSSLLYPNGAVSSINSKGIPDLYTISLVALNNNNEPVAKKLVSLKILPAEITVTDATPEINTGTLLRYSLFTTEETGIELKVEDIITENMTWSLPNNTNEDIRIAGNQIVVAGTSGDLTKKEETTYALKPTLIKDGFPIATADLKLIFIPAIKFLYGQRVPGYDFYLEYNPLILPVTGGSKTDAPIFTPEKYKGSFKITSITKGNAGSEVAFEDTNAIFGIVAETGEVTTKENTTLEKASYHLNIEAITSTGIILEKKFHIKMD